MTEVEVRKRHEHALHAAVNARQANFDAAMAELVEYRRVYGELPQAKTPQTGKN